MPEETSSLRQAIDKIMGWPAGGEGSGTVKPLAPPATNIDLNNVLGTAAEVVSPEAAAAPVAAAPAAPAPAAAPAAAPAPAVETPGYHGAYSYSPYLQSYAIGSQADPNQLVGVTMENIYDPWTQEAIAGLITQTNSAAAKTGWESLLANPEPILTSSKYNAGLAAGASSPSSSASSKSSSLRNPGPKAPWQESQQYWKDLAAQTKK